MKNKYLLLLFIVGIGLYLLSDYLDSEKKPDSLLTKKEFIEVLVDIHITDAVLEVNKLRDGDKKLKNYSYYNSVFAKHNITRQQFDDNIKYYSYNDREFSEIYEKVTEIMEEKLEVYEDEEEEEKTKSSKEKKKKKKKKKEFKTPKQLNDSVKFK